jgi:hypothetical protein
MKLTFEYKQSNSKIHTPTYYLLIIVGDTIKIYLIIILNINFTYFNAPFQVAMQILKESFHKGILKG